MRSGSFRSKLKVRSRNCSEPELQPVPSQRRQYSLSGVSAALLAAIVLWGVVIAPGWLMRLEAQEKQTTLQNAKLQAELKQLRRVSSPEPAAQEPPRLEGTPPPGGGGGVLLEVPNAAVGACANPKP